MKQGHLDDQPAIVLVRDLMSDGASGLLKLQNGAVQFTLCLLNGQVAFAVSNLKRFQPTDWLATADIATAEEIGAVVVKGKGTRSLVDALAAAGLAPRPDLVATVRQGLRAMVLEALTLVSGSYTFTAGSPKLATEVNLAESTRGLLLHAAANAPDEIRQDIHRSLDGGDTASAADAEISDTPDNADGRPAPRSIEAIDLNTVEDPLVREVLQRARSSEGLGLYELLEVETDTSIDAIRAAYYRMARRYHPDALHGDEADRSRDEIEGYFAAVTEAYNRLRDKGERAAYDEERRAGRRKDHSPSIDTATLARQNFDRGLRAAADGNLGDAYQFLSNATQLDPEKGDYHRELGIVQMQNPRWKKAAEDSLCAAIERQSTDARALAHLGALYQKNGLNRRAEEFFNRALEWDPESAVALAGLSSDADDDGGRGLLNRLFGSR